MLDQAIVELGNLNDGDIFIVRDLFKGYIWNAQDKADRLTLGTLFLNFVKQNQRTMGKKIEILDKNSANQQMYKLVDGWDFRPSRAKNCLIKTGIMEVKLLPKGKVSGAVIGTSGLSLHELPLRSNADVEKIAIVLSQALANLEQ